MNSRLRRRGSLARPSSVSASDCSAMNVRAPMLLTLRVTEERKRISSVATYRVPHIDVDRAVTQQDPPIAEQFTTTPHATARGRMTGRTQLGLLTEGPSA